MLTDQTAILIWLAQIFTARHDYRASSGQFWAANQNFKKIGIGPKIETMY
jgi:hypothetical protein